MEINSDDGALHISCDDTPEEVFKAANALVRHLGKQTGCFVVDTGELLANTDGRVGVTVFNGQARIVFGTAIGSFMHLMTQGAARELAKALIERADDLAEVEAMQQARAAAVAASAIQAAQVASKPSVGSD